MSPTTSFLFICFVQEGPGSYSLDVMKYEFFKAIRCKEQSQTSNVLSFWETFFNYADSKGAKLATTTLGVKMSSSYV
jgi:hypothetical protein